MKYFGHDCDAGDDSKLSMVIIKYTILGYGVYFRCNELIGRTISRHCTECVLQENLVVLEHKFGVPQEKIKEMLEYFVEIDLFDKTEDGKYRNLKLLKRLDEYTKKYVDTVSGQPRENVRNKEKKRNEIKRNENPLTAGADKLKDLTSEEAAVKDLFAKAYKAFSGREFEYLKNTDFSKEIEAIRCFAGKSAGELHDLFISGWSNPLENIKRSCLTIAGVYENQNLLKVNGNIHKNGGFKKGVSHKKEDYPEALHEVVLE